MIDTTVVMFKEYLKLIYLVIFWYQLLVQKTNCFSGIKFKLHVRIGRPFPRQFKMVEFIQDCPRNIKFCTVNDITFTRVWIQIQQLVNHAQLCDKYICVDYYVYDQSLSRFLVAFTKIWNVSMISMYQSISFIQNYLN